MAKSGSAPGRGVSVTVIVVVVDISFGPLPKFTNIPLTPVSASVSPVPLSTEKLKCAVHVPPGATDPLLVPGTLQVPSDTAERKSAGRFMWSLASPVVVSEVKPTLKLLKVIAPVVLFLRV